jgi:hypothetical protein
VSPQVPGRELLARDLGLSASWRQEDHEPIDIAPFHRFKLGAEDFKVRGSLPVAPAILLNEIQQWDIGIFRGYV